MTWQEHCRPAVGACSVTTGFTFGNSTTWRAWNPASGLAARSTPQPRHSAGWWSITSSRVADISGPVPALPVCCACPGDGAWRPGSACAAPAPRPGACARWGDPVTTAGPSSPSPGSAGAPTRRRATQGGRSPHADFYQPRLLGDEPFEPGDPALVLRRRGGVACHVQTVASTLARFLPTRRTFL